MVFLAHFTATSLLDLMEMEVENISFLYDIAVETHNKINSY